MAEKDREKSEFNMAVSYLNRLNNLFYVCDNSAISLDSYTWFHSLMALFRELSTEMNPDEIEKWETESGIINGMINESIEEMQRTGNTKVSNELYNKLHKFEMFLRTILKQAGLQQKMQDDLMAPENW